MRVANEPLVSVVTPFYNTAEHLGECIESVLGQSYQNWEYCLVNNCSDDGSDDVAKRYAAEDERIRVVENTEFLSQVQNYNHALRQISPGSRYTKIVQADDWMFPECLERMVRLAEDNRSAGIVGAYRLYGTTVRNCGLPYTTTVIDGKEACRFMLSRSEQIFGSPTSILFRSEILRSRDPFYSEDSLFEDTEAC
jgi:glycosyltransferase involved in cell wall biosynthesis